MASDRIGKTVDPAVDTTNPVSSSGGMFSIAQDGQPANLASWLVLRVGALAALVGAAYAFGWLQGPINWLHKLFG